MGDVIDLFTKKTEKEEQKEEVDLSTEEDIEKAWQEIMAQNRKNLERIRRERSKNNKSTLRSYNIKDKK